MYLFNYGLHQMMSYRKNIINLLQPNINIHILHIIRRFNTMCSYSLTSICTFSRFHYFQKMGITFTSVDFIHSEHRKTQTIVITTKYITWDNCKELMNSQKFQFVSHSKKGQVELTNQS